MKIKLYMLPGLFLLMYVLALSLTVFFSSVQGGSNFIDESILLIFLPFSLLGVFKIKHEYRLLNYFLIYFVFLTISSLITLYTGYVVAYSTIVALASIFLDLKPILMFLCLAYLSKLARLDKNQQFLFMCKCLLLVMFFQSLFIIRDVFSDGLSIGNIPLRESPIFGFTPIGLTTYKAHAAIHISIGLIASYIL